MDNYSIRKVASEIESHITEFGLNSDKAYLLRYGRRYFYTDRVSEEVISKIAKGFSFEDALSNAIHKHSLNSEKESRLRATVEYLVNLGSINNEPKKKPIYATFTLIPQYVNAKLCSYFSFIYNPILLAVLTLNSIVFHTYFIYSSYAQTEKIFDPVSISGVFVLIFLVFFSFLFHELGHSAAASRYKVKPGKVGFGIYLFFPVFYSDVSLTWSLTKTKRVIVNYGGIYFQSIVNVILIIFASLYLSATIQSTVHVAIWINIFSIMYNMNPFFRFDGYWMLSDMVDKPNLRGDGFEELKRRLDELIQRKFNVQAMKKNWGVIVYALSSIAFFIAIIYYFAKVLISMISNLDIFINNVKYRTGQLNDFDSYLYFIYSLAPFFLITFIPLVFLYLVYKISSKGWLWKA